MRYHIKGPFDITHKWTSVTTTLKWVLKELNTIYIALIVITLKPTLTMSIHNDQSLNSADI